MTTFPGAPRLLKGAIVGYDLFNPVASVIVFQYNPKGLKRSIQAQASGAGGSRAEVLRLKGAPTETISFTKIELDAADQLEKGDDIAASMGIHPQLAALEMLLYPKSSQVITNNALLAAGIIEVIPSTAPFTLFVWGKQRVLPVQITGFTVNEQEFDPKLNPIRAEISGLSLRVLNYGDFPLTHPGFHLFLAHQVVKETMAAIGSLNNLSSALGGDVSLL
jgi:hypothetical protein